MKIIIYILPFVFAFSVHAQDRVQYSKLINQAWQLYQHEDYEKAGIKYSEAFTALGGKGILSDRYNAACSYALAGKQDSAFAQLFKIVSNGSYTNYEHIVNDEELISLHSDGRWRDIMEWARQNKFNEQAKADTDIVANLEKIYEENRAARFKRNDIVANYGWNSEEMKAYQNTIRERDSMNILTVTAILEEHGWLGPEVIGKQGNATLFRVIQSADLNTQEKYLPLLRDAVKLGNANPSNLAVLEDRVALSQNNRQVYGSQIGKDEDTNEFYILPLEDPDNVDKRRAKVGLPPLANYIQNWNMIWDLEEYKKRLPALEAKVSAKR